LRSAIEVTHILTINNSELFRASKKLFSPYKAHIIVISVTMVLASVGSFANPWLTMQLIDVGILGADFRQTTIYVGAIFVIFIIQQLIGALQFYFYRDISIKIPYDLNLIVSKHILSMRVKYFKERNFSVVMAEIFQDISNISALTGTQFLTSFVTLFRIIAGVVALMIINWQLTLVMVSVIPIKLLISHILFKKQEAVYKAIMKFQTDFSAWLSDSISGIVEIKMWNLINSKLISLASILEKGNKTKSRLMFYAYIDNFLGTTLSVMFTCVLYIYGAVLIADDRMTIGMLVSFVAYSALVFEPVSIVSHIITQLSTTRPAFSRFLKFMETDVESDKPDAIEMSCSADINSIVFDNVSLTYESEYVLSKVTFKINKGERVAIIGLNGSGKSSIINLLLRFYEPTEGNIEINGKDISLYTFDSYRSIWSLMAQNCYIFNGSIEENINITQDLTASDIKECCTKSGASLFVENLPLKLKTPTGYNGAKLSGGERQKISLARTLAKKKSKILVLDEATSSYDYHSEQQFNKEILASSQYNITILVTHRPEILKQMDKIIFLEKGVIAGIGTFDELINSSNNFQTMIEESQKEGER